MHDPRFIRRRWWHFLIVRWLTLIGMIVAGVVLLIAAMVGVGIASMKFFPNPTPTQNGWLACIIVVSFIVAILGLIVASAWTMRRTATAFGMVCHRCGTQFDRTSFEYAAETGNCPTCVRKQHFLQTAAVPETEQKTAAEIAANPYAPPQAMEPQMPMPKAPPPSWHMTGFAQHVLRIFIATYLGWLGAIGIACLALIGMMRVVRSTRLDSQTPPWLVEWAQQQRRRDIGCALGAALLAVVLFGVGFAIVALDPLDQRALLPLHCIAGASAGIALTVGDLLSQRSRRTGRMILRVPNWGCSFVLLSGRGWEKASRSVRFRTQDERGLLLSIEDVLTGATLTSEHVLCLNPNDWNELLLPLDALAARGCNLNRDRIRIWLHPLDGQPWLLQYDETRA